MKGCGGVLSTPGAPGVDRLPKELVCLIISKLYIPFEMAQCRLVCKRWSHWINDKGSRLWGGFCSFLELRDIVKAVIPLRYRELYFSGTWNIRMTLDVGRLFTENDETTIKTLLDVPESISFEFCHEHVAILYLQEGLLTNDEFRELVMGCGTCFEYMMTDFSLEQMRNCGKRYYLERIQPNCPNHHDYMFSFFAQKISSQVLPENERKERKRLYEYLTKSTRWLALFMEGNVLYALRKGYLNWRTFSKSDRAFKADWETMAENDKQFEEFCVAAAAQRRRQSEATNNLKKL